MNLEKIKHLLGPDIINLHERNDMFGDVIFPTDQGGLFRTSQESKEIKRKIDNFYNLLSDDDIEEYNRKVADHEYPRKQIESAAEEEQWTRKPVKGYVYLLHHDGLYKIGRAKNLSKRLMQISPRMPHEVTLIHFIEADDMIGMESRLHERYADKRMNGEWFALSAADVQEIQDTGDMK